MEGATGAYAGGCDRGLYKRLAALRGSPAQWLLELELFKRHGRRNWGLYYRL